MPYHVKRYILYYTFPTYEKWYIITSANLSAAAWGYNYKYSLNIELGIAWNFN